MRLFLLFVLTCLASGCAAREVLTDAYLSDSFGPAKIPGGASFAVLPNEKVPNPILDGRLRGDIEKLLKHAGYSVDSPDRAHYLVRYAYDMEGMAVSNFRRLPPYSHAFHVHGTRYFDPHLAAGLGFGTYVEETSTRYIAKLRITVLIGKDYHEKGEENVIWVGQTYAESLNPDLREMLDDLLAATFRYFGQDTGKVREVTIHPGDSYLKVLKEESPSVSAPAAA